MNYDIYETIYPRVYRKEKDLLLAEKWLECNRSEYHKSIKKIADSPATNLSGKTIASELWFIAHYKMTSGCLGLLNETVEEGCEELNSGLELLFWFYKIRLSLWDRNQEYTGMKVGKFASFLALAFVCHRNDICDWVYSQILKDAKRTPSGATDDQDSGRAFVAENDSYYTYYIVVLYSLFTGDEKLPLLFNELDKTLKNYFKGRDHDDPYLMILNDWNSQNELKADNIEEMCILHFCSSENNFNGLFELREYPYVFWPVEIIMLYLVRKKLGLQTPVVKHQLFKSVYEVPAGAANTSTPLIEKISKWNNDTFVQ